MGQIDGVLSGTGRRRGARHRLDQGCERKMLVVEKAINGLGAMGIAGGLRNRIVGLPSEDFQGVGQPAIQPRIVQIGGRFDF